MYEGDTPNAERRAAALSLDRELLRELLGQEELRELIDPGALEQVELDLQHRSDRTRADSRDALADVLRRLGDLTDVEVADRVLAGLDPAAMLAQLEAERRAVRLRVGGEERWIAADDAGLYRDAFGAVAPSGLPEAFMADVDAPLEKLVARYARTHGPFTTGELRDRYLVDPTSALTALERAGELVRGELRPVRQRARVVRPRGPAPPAPRLAGRAAQGDRGRRPALAGRLPAARGRASTAIRPAAPASTACARCSSRCRGWRCPPTSGSATCCRAAAAPTRPRGWTSCAPAARSCGSARAPSDATRAAWRSTSATTSRPSGRRPTSPSGRTRPSTTCCASASPTRRASSPTCWPSCRSRPSRSRRRCGTSCGPAR